MENSTNYRPTEAIVNLDAIRQNVKSLRKYLDHQTSVIAVVKADGYGHGEVQVAKAALEAGAEMVSVATPDEAVRLRLGGVQGDILVMGPSPVHFAEKAAELGVILTSPDAQWIKSVLNQNESFKQPLRIHVKIDSGMGRIGLRDYQSLHELLSVVDDVNHVEIDGVFTHFSCADESDPSTTKEQFSTFMQLVESMPHRPRLVHASNTAATLLYPTYALDAVRFGMGLYGVPPSEFVGGRLPFPLQRALTLQSELGFVKKLPKGKRISYGGRYETIEDEWIGTIPIGYADGLRRGLRGQEVLIRGQRVPIVGTICMDQCMVRLPEEFPVGEKVVLLGRQGEEEIQMEEWAEKVDSIPYEITVSITKRVPRKYVGSDDSQLNKA